MRFDLFKDVTFFKFDLFEYVDVALHRLMLRSHKWYRNAIEKRCNNGYTITTFDQWFCNRLYQLHVMFKHAYMNHIRSPKKGHTLFLVTMDEVFTNASVLRVLFNNVRIRVGIKNA